MEVISIANMDPSCCLREAWTAAFTQPNVCTSQDSIPVSIEEIQDTLQKVHRIQLLHEQRITELERQLASHRESTAEFSFFSRLPPELRCRIWELALPVLVFRPFRFLQPSFLEWKSLAPPAISRVCREARYVAHKNGALYCHEFLAPLSWTWFNGHKDILDLSPYHIVEDGFIPLQKSLLQETRAIILDVDLVDSLLITGLFGESSRLPNVRTIYLMAGNTFQAERESWHPHMVARLFNSQSFAHIDIEDDEEVERLEQLLLDMTSRPDGSFMDKWHRESITRLRAQVRPPATVMEPWKKAKQLLMQGWMSHNAGASSSHASNSMIEEDEDRRAYPQMPAVKLVQTFELSPVSRLAKWYKEHGRQVIEDVRG
ncbi:hypothetical protein V8C42DRAFT_316141 [Trichoderma barbatum]